MEKKQWVQHISGQGEKWEIKEVADLANNYSVYTVKAKSNGNFSPMLPKSEYVFCEPPEVWRDVTEACGTVPCGDDIVHCGGIIREENGYRLRKVQLETPHKCGKTFASIVWAFIVEKKVS